MSDSDHSDHSGDSASSPDIMSIDTSIHTITSNGNQIQFTVFKEDNVRMVRVQADKPVILPVQMLNDYLVKINDNTTKYLVNKNDMDTIAVFIVVMYIFTLMGIGAWGYTLYQTLAKMEL